MKIRQMTGHVIVCGYGRMGRAVCDQLVERGVDTVVVEKDPAMCELVSAHGLLPLHADATDDASLAEAGIDRASALAAVLSHDADNLFVTITARSMNRKLTIIARSSSAKNEAKFIAAGADRVLNPYRNGGRLMARQLLHPAVTEFMDVLSKDKETQLSLEEIQVRAGSSLAGVMLRDAPIRSQMDVIIVGVRRQQNELIFNPPHDLAPQAGDVLVALGRPENLKRLERLADPGSG